MYRKILVPLDGSELAERILPEVKKIAKVTNASIVLLRVALTHSLPTRGTLNKQAACIDRAEQYLYKVLNQLRSDGFQAASHVRYGHAANEILAHSLKPEIDMIAMSTHGRTGFSRWALGSVTEKVVRVSKKPVLIIRCEDDSNE